jgi:hypothetical protein
MGPLSPPGLPRRSATTALRRFATLIQEQRPSAMGRIRASRASHVGGQALRRPAPTIRPAAGWRRYSARTAGGRESSGYTLQKSSLAGRIMSAPLSLDFARLHSGDAGLSRLSGLRSLWDMREIDARSFVNAVFGLGNLEIALKEFTEETAKNRTAANEITARLRRFRQELAALEARLTISEVDRFIDRLDSYAITVSEFSYFVKSVRLRLQDEMSSTKLLALNSEDQNYFSPRSPLFGDLIPNKFPTNGEFELDEAAKCLALGRPTAAVFHLMRLMEVGIRALARCLQVPDPLKPAERNWGHIIGEIKKGIDARWPTAATRAHGDGALFEQLHASLDAVRNPWRNATMHVESKYTDDQAKHILIAVKGFMEKLASRTDENGEPNA